MAYTPSLDISVRFTVAAPLVWEALSNPRRSRSWCPSLRHPDDDCITFDIDTARPPKKRPRMISGVITDLDRGSSFTADLHSEPRDFDSKITVTVSQLKHKSRLRLVEEGLPRGRYAELIAAECREGWRDALANLSDYLDDRRNVVRLKRSLARA